MNFEATNPLLLRGRGHLRQRPYNSAQLLLPPPSRTLDDFLEDNEDLRSAVSRSAFPLDTPLKRFAASDPKTLSDEAVVEAVYRARMAIKAVSSSAGKKQFSVFLIQLSQLKPFYAQNE